MKRIKIYEGQCPVSGKPCLPSECAVCRFIQWTPTAVETFFEEAIVLCRHGTKVPRRKKERRRAGQPQFPFTDNLDRMKEDLS